MLIKYKRHLQCRQQADTLFLYISACLQLSVSRPSVCISFSLSVSLPSRNLGHSISHLLLLFLLLVTDHLSNPSCIQKWCCLRMHVCVCVYFVRETINFVPFYLHGAFTGWHYEVKRVRRA